jgi:nucleoside-diphosphate-sugar epimerase
MTLRVIITGASGFVGQNVIARAKSQGMDIRAVLRKTGELPSSAKSILVEEISGSTNWGNSLCSADAVIHLAARVHVMKEDSSDPLHEFRKVNVAGTEHLARSAAASGVKRLVYVSSIKVNGESTDSISAFSETDAPSPQDPYGVSKWEAELALQRVAQETGLEVVIVRPPLVYGKGVKGNFAQMLKVLAKGIPLPLAAVHNLRSLIYVENLADALLVCVTHPAAAGHTYLVSDGEDVSTPDLLRQLGEAMGHPARLLPCPPVLLTLLARLVGKSAQIERLAGSLRVDSGKIRRELGWRPPYTMQEGLRKTIERNENDDERK